MTVIRSNTNPADRDDAASVPPSPYAHPGVTTPGPLGRPAFTLRPGDAPAGGEFQAGPGSLHVWARGEKGTLVSIRCGGFAWEFAPTPEWQLYSWTVYDGGEGLRAWSGGRTTSSRTLAEPAAGGGYSVRCRSGVAELAGLTAWPGGEFTADRHRLLSAGSRIKLRPMGLTLPGSTTSILLTGVGGAGGGAGPLLSPLAAWSLDNTLADSSGRGQTLTNNGGVNLSANAGVRAGKKCGTFSGSNWLTLNQAVCTSGPIAISLWAYGLFSANGGDMFSQTAAGGTSPRQSVNYTAGVNLSFSVNLGLSVNDGALSDNVWTNIMATSGILGVSNAKIFVNAVLVAQANRAAGYTGVVMTALGMAAVTTALTGRLCDVLVYAGNFGQSQATALYNGGAGWFLNQ